MAIIFRCANCNTVNKVADEVAGKAVRCGKCQAVLKVPAAGTSAASPPAPTPPAAPAVEEETQRGSLTPAESSRRRDDGEEEKPRPRRRKNREAEDENEGQDLPRPRNLLKARQRKKSRLGLILTLVGVGVLAGCGLCGGIGWYFYSKVNQVVGEGAVYDGGGPEAKTLPPLEDIRDGKFTRPPRTTAPTTYFHMVSTKGDYIGQGKSFSYSVNEVTARKIPHGVEVNAGPWEADFYGAGTQMLPPGEYADAHRTSPGDAPGIDVHGDGRGCNQTAGKFIVWELAVVGDQVVRLAIDFVQQCEGKGPPLYGRIRFNSTFH
jgi:hypothetical protein